MAPEHVLQDLDWRFAPSTLLSGRVGAEVGFGYLDGRGNGLVSIDWQQRLQLSDGRLRLSAASLARALAIPLAEFDGELEARVESAQWQQQRLTDLRARVQWRRAALRQPLQLSLGEVEAVVESQDENLYLARISNSGGAVSIDGEIQVNGQRVQSNIRLRPLAGAPAELGEVLAQFARRQSDGSYRIQRVGNLRDLM